MGEVYAGFDETLKRRVALKAIRHEYRLNPESRARFLREAQILSALDHPNICRVYDYTEGVDRDWLVLELIEGKNLVRAREAGIDRSTAMRIAEQVASVLVATHEAGIIHRDLKPANVMLTGEKQVKVLDFGLAASRGAAGLLATASPDRPRDSASASPPVADDHATQTGAPLHAGTMVSGSDAHFQTTAGIVMGTLAYMSPEQARAEPATAASDMYAFGVMLQELFSGRHPHPADIHGQALLERVQRGETERPSGVSRDLASLLERLTAPAPANRPTAVDAAERLRWIREKPKRRLRALAIAAALVIAVGAGVKYTFDLARERSLAVEARDEADKRREQAESLIAFMIGDLRRKLEPVGRIDVLDEVGAKAMEYFGAVPEHQLSDKELLRRSTALYQIGDVRITQGRLEEATAPLQQSLALAAALSARAPQDTERLFELGQSRYWVGFVHWRRRNLEEALTHFNEYLRISEKLVSLAPANTDWQLELSYANSNIGSVLQERGDLEGALAKFRECIRIDGALLQARPEDNAVRWSLALSHNTAGAVLTALGRLEDALTQHRAELALKHELVARDPQNTRWQMSLGVAHNFIGILMNALGNHTEAMKFFRSALAAFEQLAARDKANMIWQREVGRAYFWLGYSRFAAGTADVLGDLNRAVDVLESIAKADPTNVGWQRDVSQARQLRGEVFRAGGRLPEASADAEAALERADSLLAKSRDDREAARLRSLALILRGEIQAQRADMAAAARDWQDALDTIEPLARASMDYRYLQPWARVLTDTGRSQDAATVLARLNKIGYRNREPPGSRHATRTAATSTSK